MICKGALRGEYGPGEVGRADTFLRMRYARLSRVRKVLGCAPEDVDIPYDASTFVEDDEYLILDLVLNWVSRTSRSKDGPDCR
jgi:hypothetical protein